MEYSEVASAYEAMEKTTKRLELTQLLADLIAKTPKDIVDKVVYLTQGKLYPDFMGIEVGVADKLAMRAIAVSAGIPVEHVEAVYKRLGDIGTAADELLTTKGQATLFSEPLTVLRVYRTLDDIAKTTGQGSLETKIRLLSSLLSDASPKEARYILRTVTGRLRLGIADYTVLDALALAYTGDRANRHLLERAYNLSSDLGLVARAVASKGLDGLSGFSIQVGRPIRPMLAERLESAEAILDKIGVECASEYKLDGERVQIHLKPRVIKLFSRRLEDITGHYPDIAKLCQDQLRCKEAVVEGEAVAINSDTGEYLPFQELMHRRRKYGVAEAVEKYPVSVSFFDVLYVDGQDYTGRPYVERRERLEKIVEEGERARVVPMKLTAKPDEIEAFMEEAISEGCEGLVVKDLKSIYRAGAREFAWIKLKREYRSELTDTLDLTIIGAFHGRGRRSGRYGAFLLAAYDEEEDTFKTACKIGTGFTDEVLERFPKILEPYMIPHHHARVDSKLKADVWFTPQVVIEAIASEITLSPTHTAGMDSIREDSGLALRFPKFTGRIRDDKGPTDSTTTREMVEMYMKQRKVILADTSQTEAATI